MLTSKQFAARLQSIRKSDEALRLAVAEALAFAIFHARNHGQKTPFIELCAAVPGWLQKDISRVAVGKKKIEEAACVMEAEFRVAEWFATHDERKALRNANRVAKKAQEATAVAPQSTNADEPVEEAIEGEYEVLEAHPVSFALVMEGKEIPLSEDEAFALATILQQIRNRQEQREVFEVAVEPIAA